MPVASPTCIRCIIGCCLGNSSPVSWFHSFTKITNIFIVECIRVISMASHENITFIFVAAINSSNVRSSKISRSVLFSRYQARNLHIENVVLERYRQTCSTDEIVGESGGYKLLTVFLFGRLGKLYNSFNPVELPNIRTMWK